MKQLTLKGLFLVLVAIGLVGCGELGFNNWRWHQKMTVEVEVDGKTYTGSSVTSIHWWPNFFSGSWGGADWHSKVQGEAVVIELPNKKYLFALLSYSGNTEYTANLATRVLAKEPKHRVWGKNIFQAVLDQKGKTPLAVPEDNYPLFVTFKDINDPASVEQYYPLPDDAWRSKITMKKVTLEITDKPVTKGKVEKVLGWLENLKGGYLHGGSTSKGAPLDLYGGNFKVGD